MENKGVAIKDKSLLPLKVILTAKCCSEKVELLWREHVVRMTEDQQVRHFFEGVLLLKWQWWGWEGREVHLWVWTTLLKMCLLQNAMEPAFRAATRYYCSSSIHRNICYFPQASFILETFCFTWRMLNFASFPRSLFSVVLTGISYILRLSENTGACWEPRWPGRVPENILLNTEITASKMTAAPPHPFGLAETLKCPGGTYCV